MSGRLRAALVLALAFLLWGCSEDEGTVLVLSSFQLSASTLVEPVEVELPTNVRVIGNAPSYTLTTDVDLPPELRSKKLTLTASSLVAIARLTVDGREVAAVDSWPSARYSRPGWQAWHLMPHDTDAGTLRLAMEVKNVRGINRGVPVFRLSATPFGDRRYLLVRRVNEVAATLALGSLLTTAVLYGVSFLFDRSRVSHGWFTLQSLLALVGVAAGLTAFQPWLGEAEIYVWLLSLASSTTVGVHFLFVHFGLPLPSRWAHLLGPVGVLLTTQTSIPGVPLVALGACAVAIFICARVARQGAHAVDAALLLAAWAISAVGIVYQAANVGGLGLVTTPAAFLCFNLAQVIVVGRERARSFQSAERLNVELRRQVAERSRDLAEAFARLGAAAGGSQLLRIGDEVDGRFRVVRLLGRGGMGQVAEVVADGEHFALKVMAERPTTERLARFAREAQIAAELRHPNLIAVTDVGVDPAGRLFLVMDLVRGGSLAEQRARFGDASWALSVLEQVAAGLAALHERGIVHRDLKPANILLDGDRVRIADFGIARLSVVDEASEATEQMASPAAERLTKTGIVIGTPHYMAPELLTGAVEAVPASDLYSFGVLAHELLTKTLPPKVWRADLAYSAIPKQLSDCLAACLCPEPAARPSAQLAHEMLREWR